MTTKVTNIYNLKLTPSQFGQNSIVVNCSQYDSLFRVIQFNLFNGNAVYSIPEGSVVTIRGTKKDNTGFEYECDYSNNVVTFPLQQQITIFPGKVPAELRITNNGEIIGSWNFLFLVEESPLSDNTTISETQLPLLEQAIEAAGRLNEAFDDIAEFTDETYPNAVQSIQSEGATQVANVTNEGTTQRGLVSSEGSTQIANVQAEGTTQVGNVQAKGDEVIASIPSDYTSLVQEVNNTNESLLNENMVPVNVGIVKPHISQINNAASKGVAVTITGMNKFTMDGTATAKFSLAFDYDAGTGLPIISIEHNPVYFIIKRSDNVHISTDIELIPSYFNSSDSAVSVANKITEFNNIIEYTYPSEAKKFRTYLNVNSGASFNNVEFEYIVLYSNPLSELIMQGMITDNYTNIPLSFERKTGYYSNNGVYNTYSNIWGAEISVDNTIKYHLNYRSFYGMSETVFFDSSDNFLSATTSHGDDADYSKDFYIPNGASKMLVQAIGATEQAVLERYSLSYLNGKRMNGATLDVYEIPYKETTVGDALDTVIGSEAVSPLFGKTIAYDGDSICESRLTGTAANGGAYAKLIADKTGCTYVNNAVSGGILASAVPSGTMPHSVVNSLASLPNDADIYCIEGGVNDFWRDVPLGDYSQTDYNASVNTATVCGALEHIIRAITYYHVGKPLVFVLVHKATATINANNAGYTFDEMREKMIGILNKYAIPYYDAYLYSGLNGYNSIQSTTFLTANSSGQGDGIHPNEAGYRRYYVPQLISLFESVLPVLSE